jgi:hypothetical protein
MKYKYLEIGNKHLNCEIRKVIEKEYSSSKLINFMSHKIKNIEHIKVYFKNELHLVVSIKIDEPFATILGISKVLEVKE